MKPKLKQINKKHKTGEKSKRQLKVESKGRVNAVIKPKQKVKQSNKVIRKEQRKNKMKKQIQDTAAQAAVYGGPAGPPILVAVLPLTASASPWMLRSLLKATVDASCWQDTGAGAHFSAPQFRKRLTLRLAAHGDLFAALDLAKVADFVLLLSRDPARLLDEPSAAALLSALHAQGLPRYGYATLGGGNEAAALRRAVGQRFPAEREQVWAVPNAAAARPLLRHICQAAPAALSFREARGYLLAESATEGEDEGRRWLEVAGHVRGAAIDPSRPIHITGWGDFRVEVATADRDPIPGRRRPSDKAPGEVLARPVAPQQEVDMEEVEEEEDAEEDAEEDVEEEEELEEDDGEDEEMEEESDLDDAEEEEEEEGSLAAGSDEEIVVEEEAGARDDAELERFRRLREEEQFPDEVDTPLDVPARERFARYRSLPALRAGWKMDPAAVPPECRQLVSFTNFRHFRSRVLRAARAADCSESPLAVGRFVRLRLVPLGSAAVPALPWPHPLAVWALLPGEDRRSLVHCVLRSAADPEAPPLRSGAPAVLQLGFRRVLARPLLSSATPAAWHRELRLLPPGASAAASLAAPVLLPRCPALLFRPGQPAPAAVGAVSGCDPRRRCLRRLLLSGHPFRARGRAAVVRYMFFRPDDVLFFRAAELRSRRGARGRILEPLGTHGLMKCRFDRPVSQQDVVLMPLYKPALPKGDVVDVPAGEGPALGR